MRIEDNNEAFAMMKRALGSLEAKIREAYNKGYKDGLKDGTNQMIEELIGMMSDKWDAKSKDEPQTDWHYDEQDATWYPYKHEDEPQQKSCATCKHALGNWDGESNNCGRCCGADRRFYESIEDEPQTVETMSCAECKHRPIGAEICEEPCHYEPKDEQSGKE